MGNGWKVEMLSAKVTGYANYTKVFTRFLDQFTDINITIVYSFNNSLSLKFFQRIKPTKQFNQYNKTIQKMTSGFGFSV